MSPKLENILTLLEMANSFDDITPIAYAMRDVYDAENVAYLATNLNGEPVSSVTYSPEWAAHYQDNNYLLVDPVVQGARTRFHPMDWRRLDWSARGARNFFYDARDFGVGLQGYTIPIHGPMGQMALFAINHSLRDQDWEKYLREFSHDFLLISHFFHRTLLEATEMKNEDIPDPPTLSPREKDVLSYLAAGLNRSQTADKLRISEHTLRVYVDSARQKLNALNTTHAVATALANGVIAL